jgi:hypothetical protein
MKPIAHARASRSSSGPFMRPPVVVYCSDVRGRNRLTKLSVKARLPRLFRLFTSDVEGRDRRGLAASQERLDLGQRSQAKRVEHRDTGDDRGDCEQAGEVHSR